MPGLNDALERLVNDPDFRGRLAADPKAALAGYDLSRDEPELLASQVSDVAGPSGAMEARTSKASLVGFMSAFGDLADALSPAASSIDGLSDPSAGSDAVPQETVSFIFQQIDVEYSTEAQTQSIGTGSDTLVGQLGGSVDSEATGDIPMPNQRIEMENNQGLDDASDLVSAAASGESALNVEMANVMVSNYQIGASADESIVGGEGATDVVASAGGSAEGTVYKGWIYIDSVTQAVTATDQPDVDVEAIQSSQQTADGDVDGRDFLVWQRGSAPDADGPEGPTSVAAEGSESVVKPNEMLVTGYSMSSGSDEPVESTPGDGAAEVIAGAGASGQAGHDGDVDGRDFLAWQRQFGQDTGGPAVDQVVVAPGDPGAVEDSVMVGGVEYYLDHPLMDGEDVPTDLSGADGGREAAVHTAGFGAWEHNLGPHPAVPEPSGEVGASEGTSEPAAATEPNDGQAATGVYKSVDGGATFEGAEGDPEPAAVMGDLNSFDFTDASEPAAIDAGAPADREATS